MFALALMTVLYFCCGFSSADLVNLQQTLHARTSELQSLQEQLKQIPVQEISASRFYDHFISSLKYERSSQCLSATLTLLKSLKSGEPWALQMIDAAGKPPNSGLLVGNFLQLGSYWECVSITQQRKANSSSSATFVPIRGQYCASSFALGNQGGLAAAFSYKWGVCVPDACNVTDVNNAVVAIVQYLSNVSFVGPTFSKLKLLGTTCQIEDLPLSGLAIAGITVLALFLLLVVVGSTYEILYFYSNGHILDGIFRFVNLWKLDLSFSSRVGVSQSSASSGQVNLIAESSEALPTEENQSFSAAESNAVITRAQSTTLIDMDSRSTTDPGPSSDGDKSVPVPVPAPVETSKSVLGKIFSAFSLRINGAAIFSTEKSADSLECLHALRVFSMIWIIVAHVYGAQIIFAPDALLALQHYINSWSFQVIWNGTFSVDTFFVISGLLTTYITMKYISRVGKPTKFKWHLFYIHRYLRLTPVYAAVIFLYVSLYPYLSNGAFWYQNADQSCIRGSWANFLYINNIYDWQNLCLPHTWYLANDMQFFILSPLIIIPLFVAPLVGYVGILVLVMVSVISTAVLSSVYDISANPILQQIWDGRMGSAGPINQNNIIYVKPYCRVGAYAIGMLVGYILFRTKRKLSLSPWTVLFGWAVATGLAVLVIWVLYDPIRGMSTLSEADSAAYMSLSRIAWSISIGWIILACSTGYGGWVNKFLSWKLFAPLSRLTYCAYLVHPPLVAIIYFYVSATCDIREFPMFYYVTGGVVLSYGAALGFSLVFEAPFLALEKLAFARE